MMRKRHTLSRRRWAKFRSNRRGYYSLLIFTALFIISLGAALLSNDKPLIVRYQGSFYYPVLKTYPETTFDGDFESETD